MASHELDEGIEIRHAFKTNHIFFLNVRIERPEKMPKERAEQSLTTEVALGLPEDGEHYNLNLRIRTAEGGTSSLKLEILAVGVFEHLGEGEPSEEELTSFFNENLLTAMSSRVIQLVATLTAQMGIPPMWLPIPRGFGLDVATVKNLIDTFQPELDLSEA